MADTRLTVEDREGLGKGFARRVRMAGRVPAVVYGHGQEPRHITLPGHETRLALAGGDNVLLTLSGTVEESVIPKEVQRHPVRRTLTHVDLQVVRRGERMVVDVPVLMSGETSSDANPTQALQTLSVEADATALPQELTVDLTTLEIGQSVTAAEVELPDGATLVTEPDAVVVSLSAAVSEEALEAELAGAEAELGAGEAGVAAVPGA